MVALTVRPSCSDVFMDRLGRWLLLSISGALGLLFVQGPSWSLPKLISSNIFLKENANATLRTWNSTSLAAEATTKSSTVTSTLSVEFLATPTVRTTTTFFAKNLSYPVRPNIIWIMADDLGWGEVGLYPAHSKHGRIRTPHLDTFGREGMVFLHAYAGYCVCAPSRMSFFTGRHSGRFTAMRVNGRSLGVAQNISVFPQVLQQAGYATGAFGKTAPLDSPLQQGFSIFIGQKSQGLCHNMYPKHIDREDGFLNFPLSGNFQNKSRELCMKKPERYNYTIDVFQDAAIAWMTEVSKTTSPFFLYMSYTIPHAGGWGDFPKMPENGQPVPYDMGYGRKDWPEVERDHAAVISYMDMKIGELMEQLKSLGIDNKTICLLVKVVFRTGGCGKRFRGFTDFCHRKRERTSNM